jgi:hypothetical protein
MWYLLQGSIIFAIVASNIHWQWTPNHYVPAVLGIAAAAVISGMVQSFLEWWRGAKEGEALSDVEH